MQTLFPDTLSQARRYCILRTTFKGPFQRQLSSPAHEPPAHPRRSLAITDPGVVMCRGRKEDTWFRPLVSSLSLTSLGLLVLWDGFSGGQEQ